MTCRMFLVVVAMMVSVMSMGSMSTGWANEPPPTTGKTVGPELWGSIVINELPKRAAVRVKRIVDCAVTTEAEWVNWETDVDFPESSTDPLNYTWNAGTFTELGTDLPNGGVPIITKVKNFKIEGTAPNRVCSFDVQIKFHID